jgi:hypothetical protein
MLFVKPIEMISSPNFFSEMVEWSVVASSSGSFWFQLKVKDNLSIRRWIPAAGASILVEFMRARAVAINQPSQTFSKTAVQDPQDKSLWRVDLTQQDTSLLISGTVRFILTEGSVVNVITQPYFVTKTMIGAGC